MGHTVTSSHSPKIYTDEDIRIRKLTPLECERLQGYPDNHTKYGRKTDGTVYELSDSQRYKMIGNGISSPVTSHIVPSVFGNEETRLMSLFSGCGGTELLLPSNFKVIGHCEFDKFASDVLRYHYPEIPNHNDVTEFCDSDKPEFDLLMLGYDMDFELVNSKDFGLAQNRQRVFYFGKLRE